MDGVDQDPTLGARAPTEEESARWHEKHGVKAATGGWLEKFPDGKPPLPDEVLLKNVEINAARDDVPSLQACVYRSPTMVFVAGGPSAADHIEDIRAKAKSPYYEVYCSNATAAWLLEHGVVPKYQVIIDPKPSKAQDVAHRHPDITYLLSLNCDPSVFETVSGLKVFKFLASSGGETGKRDVDVARAALTAKNPSLVVLGGGTMMGTRALSLANPLGYRRLEYYGFDGCVRMSDLDKRVQCYAYKKDRGEAIIQVECEDGRYFDSTATFARQADEINYFRKMVSWIDIEIYGGGFIAHMLKLDRAKETPQVGYRCSEAYRDLQRLMAPEYEGAGRQYANRVYLIASQMLKGTGSLDILDYGCGKRALEHAVKEKYTTLPGLKWHGYTLDDADPKPADLVTCTDVMEHVEPECVEAVLDHIQALAKSVVFFAIDTMPAVKNLPDGRNAHICLKPLQYWEGQIKKRFIVVEHYGRGSTIIFVGHSFPKEITCAPTRLQTMLKKCRTLLRRLRT